MAWQMGKLAELPNQSQQNIVSSHRGSPCSVYHLKVKPRDYPIEGKLLSVVTDRSKLTLSEADADADRGEEEAEGGDGDEEGGPDPEPGEGVADMVADGAATSAATPQVATVAVVRSVGVALGEGLGGVSARAIYYSQIRLHSVWFIRATL